MAKNFDIFAEAGFSSAHDLHIPLTFKGGSTLKLLTFCQQRPTCHPELARTGTGPLILCSNRCTGQGTS